MSPTNNPSVHPSTRTCSQHKTVKTILAGDTSYLRKKHDMRNNRQDRNLPCYPPRLRFRESIENIKMWTIRPPNRPVSNLLFFFPVPQSFIIHHSFIIPPNDNNDWPPDSVLGSQFGYKKDGKKVDNAFFGISVPIHNGGLYQDGSVLRLVGGKGSSSGSGRR